MRRKHDTAAPQGRSNGNGFKPLLVLIQIRRPEQEHIQPNEAVGHRSGFIMGQVHANLLAVDSPELFDFGM